MASSLSNLVDNLEFIYDHDNKKCLKYSNVKDDLIVYKCLCCKRNYQKKLE